MKHLATPRFWDCYGSLSQKVREIADRCYALLKQDPHHPSLHFKKAGKLWSVRVVLHHRALAAEKDGNIVWFWIGSHAEYDQLVQGG